MNDKLQELIKQATHNYVDTELKVYNERYRQAGFKDFLAGATHALQSPAILEAAGLVKKEEWIDVKPLNDKERLFMSATYYDGWNYQTWQLVKMEGEGENGEAGYYYGLCDESGEEWGDYDDLKCDLYFELPLPAPPSQLKK